MLLVKNLLGQIALANKSFFLSDVDLFSEQELTKCIKLVNDTITAIQLKKLTAGEFFGEWLKCKVQLLHESVQLEQLCCLTLLDWL